MNIKDPEVRRMARELAARRGTSATGAVREALREALADLDVSREGTADRLLELATASRRVGEPIVSDQELHDEQGLPR